MNVYKVNDYIEKLKEYNQLIECVMCEEFIEKEVEFLTYNSRDVKQNSMFVCKGFLDNFKEEYLVDAIKNGAFIYVAQKKYNVESPCIIVKDSFISLSILSSMYYDFPDEELNLIGITGTKGKSTTAYYIKYILDEYAKEMDKKDTAIISSIDTYDGVERVVSHITTPESLDMYRIFRNSVNSGVNNLVMEVSSQALKIGRVYPTNFNIGIFLNISEDHISPIEHPDFEDYFDSKLKIFNKCKTACVNLDADYSEKILKNAKQNLEDIITFSIKNKEADVFAYDIKKQGFDTIFRVKTKDFDEEFILTMPGIFNVENALAAICVACKMNIPKQYIYIGLKNARTSGRMEIYHTQDNRIVSIVDYAHNKLSFEKLFESTKNEYPDRKIISIFGCPGNKAYLRRRDLGIVAGKNSDKIYLVADDPGNELAEDISKEIAKYVQGYMQNYEIIEDRGQAIMKAIEYANENYQKTVILIAGKGNEKTQKYGSEYIPCKSDVENVKMCIEEYNKKRADK